jgi:glucosylceramidase
LFLTALNAQTQKQNIVPDKKVTVITTADSTKFRLTETATLQLSLRGQPLETEPCIFIDSARQFQTFIGIGGALTDAAAETFFKLSPKQQDAFLEAYFDKEKGIGYTLARTNMNSCDFSSDMYTSTDENDKDLKTFNINHDLKFKVPFIKRAFETAKGKLKLFISPWSPPAWMKDNKNMLHGGKLLPEWYSSWANYYIRFIMAYQMNGIPVWGLSVQNEPMATQTWESCIYTAEEERDFIKNYLGPALWKNNLRDKKLIAWDHNRDLIYQRASVLLSDKESSKYIWGIGFHWYESWTGAAIPENIKRVAEAFPDKQLLLTEACNYPFSWETIDQWQWGENYGSSMISDFNNGACAWTDWNILLDETGGPNHVNNFCFAPVHADTRSDQLHFMNSYYYIGHFSRYIRPGARRIACSSSRAQLLATGFKNQDGSLAIIVMNPGKTKVVYHLYIGNQAAETIGLPHSIVTFLVD